MTTRKFTRRNVLLCGAAACTLPYHLPAQEREVEGGIGGTGIVGILTDFGSLIIGGHTVETLAQTRYESAFGQLTERDLALGDSLTVEAVGDSDNLVARRIHVTYPLVGQVASIEERAAVINGVTVTLSPTGAAPRIGDRVAVSGLWKGTTVVASRIARAGSPLDLIAGDVSRVGLSSLIGGVKVRGGGIGRAAPASFATALGTFDPGTQSLAAQTVRLGRFTNAAGPLQRLAIEGFLEPAPRAPGYRVSGLGHSFARNLNLAPFAASRTLFIGPYDETFAANRAITLSENLQERRTVLRSLASKG